MIESIEFTNFKALVKTTLPLAPFTLLLGPNGSGKTSVLQALRGIAALAAQQAGIQRQDGSQDGMAWASLVSVTAKDRDAEVEVKLRVHLKKQVIATFQWQKKRGQPNSQFNYEDGNKAQPDDVTL